MTDVADLVPLAREIHFDDTLDKFKQVGRFDIVDRSDDQLRAQLLIDRRHKENPKLSKPLGYFRISTTDQLINIIVDAMSLAIILTTRGNSAQSIEEARDGLYQLIKGNVVFVTQAGFNDLRMHRKAREMSKE